MPADGTLPQQLSPEGIRALRAERPEMRARDFAKSVESVDADRERNKWPGCQNPIPANLLEGGV